MEDEGPVVVASGSSRAPVDDPETLHLTWGVPKIMGPVLGFLQ